MPMTLRTAYASEIDALLKANLVTQDNAIFSTSGIEGGYLGGAIKIQVQTAESTLSDYSTTNLSANGVTYGSNNYITVTSFSDKMVNEYIDNYEASAVPGDIIANKIESASFVLSQAIDTEALTCLVNASQGKDVGGSSYASGDPRYQKAGTVLTVCADACLDNLSSVAYKTMTTVGKKLTQAKVPQKGRFAIVNAEMQAALLNDDKYIRQGDLSQQLKDTGAIGQIAGLTIYSSESMPNGADISISNVAYYGTTCVLAGHMMYNKRYKIWAVEPTINDVKTTNVIGGSMLQGRKIYKHTTTKPETVVAVVYPTAKS